MSRNENRFGPARNALLQSGAKRSGTKRPQGMIVTFYSCVSKGAVGSQPKRLLCSRNRLLSCSTSLQYNIVVLCVLCTQRSHQAMRTNAKKAKACTVQALYRL